MGAAIGSIARHGATLLVPTAIETDDRTSLAESTCISTGTSEQSSHRQRVRAEAAEALERERCFTMDLWAIANNRMWLKTPSAPIRAPPVPPLPEWKCGCPSVKFENDGHPWPAGVGTHDHTVGEVVRAFLRFAWQLKGEAARMPLVLCVLSGVLPSVQAVLLGQAVDTVSEANKAAGATGDARAQVQREVMYQLLLCAVGYALAFEAKAAADYRYNETVPISSFRQQMQHVLHRELLLKTEAAKGQGRSCKWAPGTCAGLVTICVDAAIVNTWGVLFPFVRTVALCAAQLAVVAYTARNAVRNYFLMLVGFAVLTIGPVPFIYRCRQRVCVDMAARALKWQLHTVALAVEQHADQSAARSILAEQAATEASVAEATGAQAQAQAQAVTGAAAAAAGDVPTPAASRLSSRPRTAPPGVTLSQARAFADVERAATDFGDVVLITKQRAFASFFIDLVARTTDCQFNLLLFVATLITAGLHVVDGHLSLGGFAVLLSTASNLQVAAETMAAQLVQLPHGYAALRHLGEVFNDEGAEGASIASGMKRKYAAAGGRHAELTEPLL